MNKYKKITGIIINVLLLLTFNRIKAQEQISIDSQQVQLMQQENQIIGYFMEDGTLTDRKLASHTYRKFIKKNAKGHYLVQDFYTATQQKNSDSYTLSDINDLNNWQVKSIEGLLIHWYENAQKRQQATLEQGQLQGSFHVWYDTGGKFIESFYKDNKRHGLVTQWHKDGSKQVEVNFSEGLRQGVYLEWEQSKLVRSGHYVDDRKQGVWAWYSNDIKVQEGQYINDKKEGIWIRWAVDGKKILEEFYKNGLSEGLSKYWDSKGNLIRRAFYKEGLLQWSADSFNLNGL